MENENTNGKLLGLEEIAHYKAQGEAFNRAEYEATMAGDIAAYEQIITNGIKEVAAVMKSLNSRGIHAQRAAAQALGRKFNVAVDHYDGTVFPELLTKYGLACESDNENEQRDIEKQVFDVVDNFPDYFSDLCEDYVSDLKTGVGFNPCNHALFDGLDRILRGRARVETRAQDTMVRAKARVKANLESAIAVNFPETDPALKQVAQNRFHSTLAVNYLTTDTSRRY